MVLVQSAVPFFIALIFTVATVVTLRMKLADS